VNRVSGIGVAIARTVGGGAERDAGRVEVFEDLPEPADERASRSTR
jgi:hypothetical protein